MNRVDIEVTGTNKFDRVNDAVVKDVKRLEQQVTKATAETKKLDAAISKKPNTEGIKEAERAVKKLADSADDAFDKLKDKLNTSLDKLGKDTDVKIRANVDIDKDRLKSSLDNMNFDFGKINVGGKGVFSSIFEGMLKGVDATKAGAKSAFDFVSGLSEGLKAQHPAVQAAVYGSVAVAALTVAPFAGAAIAGGVVAGFGGGIAALGIVAAAQGDRVRSAYSDLWDEITQGSRNASGAIELALVNTAGRAKTVASRIKADVVGALNDVAPGLERLFDGALRSVEKFAPALRPLASAASAVFDDLGERLPGIVEELAESFSDLAEVVEANPEALGDFVAVLGEVVEAVLDTVGALSYMYNGMSDVFGFIGKGLGFGAFDQGAESVGKAGTQMTKLSDVTGTASTKLSGIEQSFRDLAEAEDDAAKRGDAFLDILNRINGIAPSFDDAMQESNDTIRGLLETFTKSGAAADGFGKNLLTADGRINTMTANGSKLYDAISSLRENFADMAGSTKELEQAGLSHEEAVRRVNDAVATQAKRLVDSADKMGLNQSQMRELLRLYGLTPEQIDTLLKLDDADFRNRMAANLAPGTKRIQVVYAGLTSTLTQGTGRTYGVTNYAQGGNVSKAAAGGVRSSDVVINDGPGFPGEAVRLPNGSTVWPAGMTNMMMKQAARGATGGGGGGSGTRTLEWIGPPDIIQWLKTMVRENGGDASVFGGGS